MKILVVDNDAALARVVGRICSGHDVTIVNDPALALGLVRSGARFDAILCDQNMPGTTGSEILTQTRLRFGRDAPLLLLMTGDDEVVCSAADAVLMKPFHSSELLALLGRAVVGARESYRGAESALAMRPVFL